MVGICWGLAIRSCWLVLLPVTCGENKPRWAYALKWATLIAASAACRFGFSSTERFTRSLSGCDLNAAHQRAETSAPEMKRCPGIYGGPLPGSADASLPLT